MLELKNITYSVSAEGTESDILRGIDLTVADGSLLVLTGPNGGGKTTLAKIIMGLVTPTGGQLIWNGTDITGLGITERARLGISYGFQQPPRFKGIRVRDLLSIASGKKLLPRAEACSYLTQVGLCARDYIDREVDASLSGGEVKRIEIATILARQSGLMIFDEPEAGIDLWSFARLTETFEELHGKRETTMIIISHQERIISLADEIAVIDGGVIARRGSAKEMLPTLLGVAVSPCPVISERGEQNVK
ncbi:MAG: ATP-binding cassette domain-containing protein [Oscillospiraceae bacterium]|nr:ATP-binding cassette domain-containing protein [Oscillospiraceae bacterium]